MNEMHTHITLDAWTVDKSLRLSSPSRCMTWLRFHCITSLLRTFLLGEESLHIPSTVSRLDTSYLLRIGAEGKIHRACFLKQQIEQIIKRRNSYHVDMRIQSNLGSGRSRCSRMDTVLVQKQNAWDALTSHWTDCWFSGGSI
jgi:hypothetical protein